MCYKNITPIEYDSTDKVFYRAVLRTEGEYYSVFVFRSKLPTNVWIRAKNVPDRIMVDRQCLLNGFHSYIKDFTGFGVFESENNAIKYVKSCSYSDYRITIVKVLARGNPRSATTHKKFKCLIFDEIKIID